MVDVLGVRTKWSPRCVEGVVAASCGRSDRRVMRTDRMVAASCVQSGCRVMRSDSMVAVSSVRTEWLPCRADAVVAVLHVRTEWLPCRTVTLGLSCNRSVGGSKVIRLLSIIHNGIILDLVCGFRR